MTTYDNRSPMGVTNLPAPPFWVCLLLGIVLIVAGFMVLGDVVLATVISTIFIGWMAIVAGGFEIVHAFWTKGWGGFAWQVLLGVLLLLLVSGCVRIVLGVRHWREAGWIMMLSGVFGVLAGLVILTRFPMTGLWVLGFLLGVDLIWHGVGWLSYAWYPRTRSA